MNGGGEEQRTSRLMKEGELRADVGSGHVPVEVDEAKEEARKAYDGSYD